MPRIPDWLKEGFAEAIAYQSDKIALPADTLKDLEAEYHDFAFVVSGLARADLASDLLWLIERALSEGLSLEEFIQQFDRLIGRKGWQPEGNKQRRLYTILDTNMRRAHAAGRLKQMREPSVLSKRPYWMWQWRDSVQPRPNHEALNGKVFLASDPFWDVAFCPCGYGCRCTVFALSERDMKRLGKTVSTPPDPKTIADKGFRRAPGTALEKDRAEILREGLKRQSPLIREAAETELRKRGIISPGRRDSLSLDYDERQIRHQVEDIVKMSVYSRVDRAGVNVKRNCRQGFPCKGTCISKLKNCTDTTSGKPTTHKEYITQQLNELIKKNRLNEADAVLYTARRIVRLPTERARRNAIENIRDRLNSSEQLNAVLEAVDIETGISNPRKLAENIANLRIESFGEEKLKLVSGSLNLKPVKYDNKDVESLSENALTDVQQQAKFLVLEHQGVLQEMNELLTRAKSQSLNDEEYQVAYSKTGELAARLKTITDRAKDIANKTNHPVLTDRVNRLSAISKEALPGHEIVVPKDLTELKKRAVRRDC